MKKTLLTLLGVAALVSSTQASTWNGSSGNWNDDTAAGWNGTGIPNAIGANATIAPSSNSTIDLTGGPWTVGNVTLGVNTSTGNVTLNNSTLTFQVGSGSATLALFGNTGQGDNVISSSVLLNSNLTIDGNSNSSGAFNKTIFAGSFDVNGKAVTISGGRKSVVFNSLTGTAASSITLNNASGQEAGITGNNSNYAGSFTVTSGRLATHYSATYTANANSLGTGLINLNTNRVNQSGLSFDGLRLFTNGATVTFSTGGIQSNQTTTNYGNLGFASSELTLGTAVNYLTGTGNLRLGGDRGFNVASTLGAFSNNITGKVRLDQFFSTTAGSTVFRVSNGFDLASAAALELGNGGLYATSNTTITTANWTVVAPAVSGITGQAGSILGANGGTTLKLTGNFADTSGATAQPLLIGRVNITELTNTAGTGTVELSGTGSLSNPITFFKSGSVDPRLLLSNTSGTQTFSGNITGSVATAKLERNGSGGTTILSGTNTYTGTTTVTAGTLLINGGHTGGAAYTVNGGILGGTGTIATGTTTGITVNSGGAIAAGNGGSGTLILDGGSTSGALLSMTNGSAFSFTLGAANASTLVQFNNYAGATDFARTGTVNLDFSGAQAGTFTLFTFYSDGGSTATASGISSGLTWGTGLTGYTSTLNYNANDITLSLVAVPEPSTYALLGMGLVSLVVVLRRRQRMASK